VRIISPSWTIHEDVCDTKSPHCVWVRGEGARPAEHLPVNTVPHHQRHHHGIEYPLLRGQDETIPKVRQPVCALNFRGQAEPFTVIATHAQLSLDETSRTDDQIRARTEAQQKGVQRWRLIHSSSPRTVDSWGPESRGSNSKSSAL
jgi:hypothetical protein